MKIKLAFFLQSLMALFHFQKLLVGMPLMASSSLMFWEAPWPLGYRLIRLFPHLTPHYTCSIQQYSSPPLASSLRDDRHSQLEPEYWLLWREARSSEPGDGWREEWWGGSPPRESTARASWARRWSARERSRLWSLTNFSSDWENAVYPVQDLVSTVDLTEDEIISDDELLVLRTGTIAEREVGVNIESHLLCHLHHLTDGLSRAGLSHWGLSKYHSYRLKEGLKIPWGVWKLI